MDTSLFFLFTSLFSSPPGELWEICCSLTQLYPTPCDPMDCSTPGFPVFHHLSELAQTHVRWVGDAIQPSHPLLSPLLLPSVFSSVSALHIRWPKYWRFGASLFMNIQGWFLLGFTGLSSLWSKGLSRVFPDLFSSSRGPPWQIQAQRKCWVVRNFNRRLEIRYGCQLPYSHW